MHDLLIKGGNVIDGTGTAGFTADVAIKDGRIAAIGRVNERCHRLIDADGLLVTPGFVDIHTHYDGQSTWDPVLDPSFGNGVTTAVMGNCGVGFAPVRPGDQERLVELMEGVEEIPGTALAEGMSWGWETFPEYLDVLAGMNRTIDLAAMVPHGALRAYVLGEKVESSKGASPAELDRMVSILDEAMQAGAMGLSSSRTPLHRTALGAMTPDFDVDEKELMALGRIVGEYRGVFQFAPLGNVGEDLEGLKRDMAIYEKIAFDAGANVHLLVAQTLTYPGYWREQLAFINRVNRRGGKMKAQVAGRGVCVMMSFFNTNPFMYRHTFRKVTTEPRDQWLEILARPEVRQRILSEPDPENEVLPAMLKASWHAVYDMGSSPNYEPAADTSIQAIAGTFGCSEEEVAYDRMLHNGDRGFLLAPLLNYASGSLEPTLEMLCHPASVLSSSDAGAHVNTVCDGAVYSFVLSYWGRDRTCGEKIELPELIKLMTRDPARSFSIHDRGELKIGMKADVNVIDMENLAVHPPRICHDLPAGAGRLLQDASGYRATVVAGEITREYDQDTGLRPGRLLRHAG